MVLLFSTSLSFIGLVSAVFGVAYTQYTTTRPDYDRDNMQSWTCRWVNGASSAEKLFTNGLADIAAPAGFKRVCNETHVGFSLLGILVGLKTLVVISTGLCAWLEVKMKGLERSSVRGGYAEKDVPGQRFI